MKVTDSRRADKEFREARAGYVNCPTLWGQSTEAAVLLMLREKFNVLWDISGED